MSIPIIIFLYIYIFAVAVFALGSIFVLYHILRFGFEKTIVLFSSLTYIIISVAILLVSIYKISQIDWSLSIDLTLGFGIF